MTGEEIDEIARAAELHDVGKVGIPDAILDKPGALDATEWEFMHQHTILGERILNAAPALRPVARHRALDARALGRRRLPRRAARRPRSRCGARIVAVCDAYEAMTDRPRLPPRRSPHEAACQELRAMAGTPVRPGGRRGLPRRDRRATTRSAPGTPSRSRPPLQVVADRVRTLLARVD